MQRLAVYLLPSKGKAFPNISLIPIFRYGEIRECYFAKILRFVVWSPLTLKPEWKIRDLDSQLVKVRKFDLDRVPRACIGDLLVKINKIKF